MVREPVAVCYDLPAISRFFRSVATCIVLQMKTSTEWVQYKDSAVLNGIYKVLFWKEPPGFVEVRTADPATIERDVNRRHLEFVMAWINKLATKGPVEADRYVRQMSDLRDSARLSLNELYRDASAINSEVIGETQQAIENLAKIRLAATVGVAVIGGAAGIAFASAAMGGAAAAGGGVTLFGLEAGASATTFGAVGFGHSVIKSVIKNWESAPSATVAAVNADTGMDTAKYLVSEGGGKYAEHAFNTASRNATHARQVIDSANGLIRQHSDRLAEQTLRKAAERKSRNIVARSTAQVVQQTARLGAAQTAQQAARFAGKGVPVVFAAWDIIDAWSEYNTAVGP